jgi:hypothetical protein
MIINDSTIVGTTKLIGPLANNTTFFWRVRAMNSIGNSPFSKANNLKTIESIPFTPTIIYPLNGASDQPINLTLQWNGDPKANSYRIQVSTSQDFSSLFIDDSTYTASLKSIGPLRYNTTYYWRVSAKNSAGVSSFSLSSNFKTISNNIPLAISGADQTVKEGENVILDGSKSYDPDGNSINFIWTIPSIITLSSTTVAKLTFIAPEVKKDSVLHFSLIVNDGSDNSVPSNVKVNVQNVIKVGFSEFSDIPFKVYPNTTKGIIHIEFAKNFTNILEVSIYDIRGALLIKKEIADETMLYLDLSDQPKGIYMLSLKSNNRFYLAKLIIL